MQYRGPFEYQAEIFDWSTSLKVQNPLKFLFSYEFEELCCYPEIKKLRTTMIRSPPS